MNNVLNDIISKDKNIKWNIEHTIKFNGNSVTKLELKKITIQLLDMEIQKMFAYCYEKT